MNAPNRGSKHVCWKCESKHYDMGKPVVSCPLCGVKPLPEKAPKAAPPVRKAGYTAFKRYPA